MFGYYTPVLLLQAFCLYHAYRNNNDQKWFWLIIFFPLVGCLIYLYQEFYNRGNVEKMSETMKSAFNGNYNIQKLEKALQFSDSITNRINLADAYVSVQRYEEAIKLYESCLEGFKADDPVLLMKILETNYALENYKKVIAFGQKLADEKTFKKSEARICYAWALCQNGDSKAALNEFEGMDNSYTNYPHRLSYCHFLIQLDKNAMAKEKLEEILGEFEHMSKLEQKQYSREYREARNMYRSL